MNVKIVPYPKHVPQSSIGGAGHFSDFIGGAFGYVREHNIKRACVSVELRNGIKLHSVAVPSRSAWVADLGNDKSTGSVDLPPVGSLVFVLFPYGVENTSGAMVIFSVFDENNKKHQGMLSEGDESKLIQILEGGLKTTYNRADPSYLVEDLDDTNFKILVDKKNEKIELVDWSGNKATLNSDGMILEDAKGNKVTGSSSGLKLEAKSNVVDLTTGKVTINGNLEVSQ